jgi:hypothetical protein
MPGELIAKLQQNSLHQTIMAEKFLKQAKKSHKPAFTMMRSILEHGTVTKFTSQSSTMMKCITLASRSSSLPKTMLSVGLKTTQKALR